MMNTVICSNLPKPISYTCWRILLHLSKSALPTSWWTLLYLSKSASPTSWWTLLYPAICPSWVTKLSGSQRDRKSMQRWNQHFLTQGSYRRHVSWGSESTAWEHQQPHKQAAIRWIAPWKDIWCRPSEPKKSGNNARPPASKGPTPTTDQVRIQLWSGSYARRQIFGAQSMGFKTGLYIRTINMGVSG